MVKAQPLPLTNDPDDEMIRIGSTLIELGSLIVKLGRAGKAVQQDMAAQLAVPLKRLALRIEEEEKAG